VRSRGTQLISFLIAPALLIGLWSAAAAQAEKWPQRPVVIVVPFAAGGNTDGIARMTAQRLGEIFGQQFVVENRAGAGGATAAEAVARAEADGYTLFMAALPVVAIVPAMNKVRYNPTKDFVPISNIGTNPFVLVINKDVPATNLAEFIAYVRARPNTLSYGSAGAGSLNHLTMALFLKMAGLEMIHVGYKGNGPALADIIAGHIPAMFSNLSDALPHASGAVRLLAVSSERRVPQIPDVPTVAESGYPQFKTLTWNGLMAPAGTPRAIVDRISGEIARATRDPAFVERLSRYGVDPLGDTPEAFAAMIAADIALWSEAVNVAGVKGP
jgi:tripartite-type tricarboxylate transporter receptor subunit TctC